MPMFRSIAVTSLLLISVVDAFVARPPILQPLSNPQPQLQQHDVAETTWSSRYEQSSSVYSFHKPTIATSKPTSSGRPFRLSSLFMSTRDTTDCDFYKILGVPRGADTNEIKQAYRRLARLYHPDANVGKESTAQKFQQLNRAYEVLRDPRMRLQYDMAGEDGLGTSAASDEQKRRSSPFGRKGRAGGYGARTGSYGTEYSANEGAGRYRTDYGTNAGSRGYGNGYSTGYDTNNTDERQSDRRRGNGFGDYSNSAPCEEEKGRRTPPSSSPFGGGFGDFSKSSERSKPSDFVDFSSADHTHVEFGNMSDPYYRGKGRGPRKAASSGESIPSDQHKHFDHKRYTHEVRVEESPRSNPSAYSAYSAYRKGSTSASTSTSTQSEDKTSTKKKPFDDERFYGKQADKSDSFFGGNRPGAHPGRTTVGEDIRVDWEIDLRRALFGGNETVRVPCKEVCSTCEGIGAEPGSEISECRNCGGNGSTTQVLRTPRGNVNSQQKCQTCKGSGRHIENPCGNCNAQGLKKATRMVNITIPPFMEDGNMVRLLGEGNPGPNGGPPGDLYIFLWTKDDSTFYREGDKIYAEETIDLVDAVLGCSIETPFVKFDVPPRTQHDHVIRLKGHGAPKRSNPKERGDYYVTVKIEMPTDLTKEEEELFFKLKELRNNKIKTDEKQKSPKS